MAKVPEQELLPCPKCGHLWWWLNTKPEEAFCPPSHGCNTKPEEDKKAVRSVRVVKIVSDVNIGHAEVYISDGSQLYRLTGLTAVTSRSEIDSINEFEIKGYVCGENP